MGDDVNQMRTIATETVVAALSALNAVGTIPLKGSAAVTDAPTPRERDAITQALASLEEQEHVGITLWGIVHRVRQQKHDFLLTDQPNFRGRWWGVEFPPNDASVIPELERAASILRTPRPDGIGAAVTAVIRPLEGPPIGSLAATPCQLVMLVTEAFIYAA